MRLISQDGTIDIPYEMSAIRNDDNLIILCMVGETGKGSVIARYSTSDKAQKAMEMLHNDYYDHVAEKTYHQGVYYIHPCFQFPQDEDVEV